MSEKDSFNEKQSNHLSLNENVNKAFQAQSKKKCEKNVKKMKMHRQKIEYRSKQT